MKVSQLGEFIQLFHEFQIVELEIREGDVIIKVDVPWEDAANHYLWDYEIHFMSVVDFRCIFHEIMSDRMIPISTEKFRKDSEERITSDTEQITQLNLTINNTRFNWPNECVFWCSGDKKIEFAQLIFKTDNFQVFDNQNNELFLTHLKDKKNHWWENHFSS